MVRVGEVTTIYRLFVGVCLPVNLWFAKGVFAFSFQPQNVRMVVGLAAIAFLAACSGGSSTDGDSGPAHSLEPTDQMRDLAVQQCLDDPSKDQGVVKAVDPDSDDEDVFAEVVIDCDSVR